MTEAQKKMIEKLGLKEEDFTPSRLSDKERIQELEEALELLLSGVTE